MLVLSRRREQAIMIGDDIEIVVVDVRGDKVRVGVRAPDDVPVHRREIYDQVIASKVQSTPAIETAAHSGDPFLLAAIEEAKKGLAEGGLPIGSVLVRGNEIVGRGHNRRVQHQDPMAHAEIDCLTHAGRQRTYKDTVLYSTLMPCYLCSGAVVQFGIPKVIVGESVNYPGCCDGNGSPKFMRAHNVDVTDINDSECIEMMAKFIRDNPALWNEDIGVD